MLAGAAPGAHAARNAAQAGGVFQHGVASGDPMQDRVVLWTRVSPSVPSGLQVAWEVSANDAFTAVLRSGTVVTGPERDFTVKIDVDGLSAGTTYWYRFRAEGATSTVGRTRTLPAGSLSHARFAVVSCSSLAHGYFNAYRTLAERDDVDFVVHLGDYIYEYGSGEYGSVREYEPAHEIVDLRDYRTRHAQYKRDADLQAVHARHPFITTWDDHESANNAWKGGAQNHTAGAIEGTWAARVAAATQAYHEWMPIRTASSGNLLKINRGFQIGNLAELLMLETRLLGRSEQIPSDGDAGPDAFLPSFSQTGEFADPARSMLGEAQEQWLYGRLRSSPARWKLLGQGVMMAQVKLVGMPNDELLSQFVNPDAWDGYDPARQRLFSILAGEGQRAPVGNTVVLTGDIHSSWASDLAPDPNNPIVRTGGYDPETGEGSLAVEFVTTSVTSPALELEDGTPGGLEGVIHGINPHIKFVELTRHGYLVIDITRERVAGEWWYVDTTQSEGGGDYLGAVWEVRDGSNHVTQGVVR